MKDPVATRALNCTIAGKREEIVVSIGQPREDDRCFRCDYKIVVQNHPQQHAICGVDAMHAIQLAMFMIGSTLGALEGTSNWTWNGEPGTGFPAALDEPIIGLAH